MSPLLWLAVAATGCGSGGSLKVTKISAAADQPANVAVYLDVKDKLGRPIPNLQEKNFRVYEDGKLRYAGKVGAGFNDASRAELLAAIEPLGADEQPFVEPPPRAKTRTQGASTSNEASSSGRSA